jgi:hypothetical protein
MTKEEITKLLEKLRELSDKITRIRGY